MLKKKLKSVLALLLSLVLVIPNMDVKAAQTITDNKTGSQGGYDYELWKDNGTTSMTLNDGGTFDCSWSNINNALFRKGKKFNSTQTHEELGNMACEFGCQYQPSGNSYLCIYGWTKSPLVEYYIVESWGSWRPPGASSKGQVTVDGGTYDIYETTRVNQPSIEGNTTFQQYWSVRTSKRTSGTISITDHFKAWESKGMKLGKMYEVALTVEGYQSSGKANVYKNDIIIGGESSGEGGGEVDPPEPTKKDAFAGIEAELYDSTNADNIEQIGTSDGGGGIGYIEAGNTTTYKKVDFGTGANSVKICYATESEDTTVQLRSGSATGDLLGTIALKPTDSWDTYQEMSANISKITGEKDLVLVFSGPVNLDWLKFDENAVAEDPTTQDPTTGDKKLVAITFDDGPNTKTTPLVLDKLEKYGVVASFFLIGKYINYDTQAIIDRQVKMGCEIASHSYSHDYMDKMSAKKIKTEMSRTSNLIEFMTGQKPRFFRAPYLATSETLFNNVDVPFIAGIGCNDWEDSVSASQRAQTIINNVKDGSIVLLHDFYGNDNTVEALDTIIPWLLDNNYELVTVSELFERKGVDPNVEGKVWTYTK